MIQCIKQRLDSVIISAFIIIQLLIYITFLYRDYNGDGTTIIKYYAIILCLGMGIYISFTTRKCLIMICMAFTLLADTFLLLIGEHYVIGVAAFCIVETLYAYWLMKVSNQNTVIIRAALFIVAVVAVVCLDSADMLTVLSMYSYTQLIMNVIHSFCWCIKCNEGMLSARLTFAVGLLLFLICDTCVGLNNLITYMPDVASKELISMANYSMWLFYLPSQVLILLGYRGYYKTNVR